ncbi:MAG: glutathione S-transferase family protein [Deltaproteobacteria bacterium]|nr:glutathione S-transferase family protein [Deltaproteobacteria bacterium]
MSAAPIVLYGFQISHYVEKVRWAMDYCGIEYREVQWTPMYSIPRAHLKAGGRTLPFIEVGKETVQDSTEILHWLHQHRQPFPVMPADEEQRQEAMEIEDLVDDVGFDIIRYMYATLVDYPADLVRLWGWSATPLTRFGLRASWPLTAYLMRYNIGFTDGDQAQGISRIDQVMEALDAKLSDGRQFLLGEQFSIADISAASILAPTLMPPEHPLYSCDTFVGRLAEQAKQFEHHPSYHWMRKIYQQYRYASHG